MSARAPKAKKPRLIIVAAPSGAGKTTLCDMLLKDFPGIALSISTTTRPRRPNEQEGVHYFFVSVDEFQKRVGRGEFAEWALVHNNCYGTAKSTIEKYFAEGKHILFDIDVQGAMNLKSQYPDRTLLIFIHPPSIDVLVDRLEKRRGDSAEAIATRIKNAKEELEWAKRFDYEITNDDLKAAYAKLKAIVQKECE